MYQLDKFRRKKDCLKYYMPFGRIVEPGVVVNKDGSLLSVFQFRGSDLDSEIKEQLAALTVQMNHIFLLFGTGWVFYFEAQRKPSTAYEPDVFFPEETTKAIDEERKALFSSGTYYESDYYASVYWKPPLDAEGRAKDLVVEGKTKRAACAADHVAYFLNHVRKLYEAFLYLQLPEVRWLSQEELLTYLHFIVSGKNHRVKVPDVPLLLDSFLYDTPLTGGIEPMLGDLHMRVVVPTSFTSESQFGMFNALNRLDFPYRWVTRFYFVDKQEMLSELDTFLRRWKGKEKSFRQMIYEFLKGFSDPTQFNPNAREKVNEVSAAGHALEADEVGYGFYSCMVILLDQNKEAVEKKAKMVEQTLIHLGFDALIETVNVLEAWVGSIPGAVNYHIRRPLVSTGNLIHCMPISDIWAGQRRNFYLDAPALLYTQTDGSTPFRLNLHIGDVGHTLMIGPTGAGKSVHLNLIAAQFCKYRNAKVFIFDKGASSRVMTAAVGGNFYDLGNEEASDISFQPLAGIDDDQERAWVQEWLYDFIRKENVMVTPEVKKTVEIALVSIAKLPVRYRTMTTLVATVQNPDLKITLHPLTLEGAYGKIFDSDSDDLKFTNWQVFEMETLMKNQAILSPALLYIFHRIEQQLTGTEPVLINLDEYWACMKHAEFAQKTEEWLRELRKKNASVVFATQGLSEIVGSPIFNTVLENCKSMIFLPNSKAAEQKTREMYQAFGLNDQQITMIAAAVPKKQYYYTSEIGSRLYDLVLGKEALAYCAVSAEDQIACKKILAQYGREGFVKRWRAYKGL